MLTAVQGKEEQKDVCTYKRHRQCVYQRDIEARSRNHSCRGKKQLSHILSAFVALGIQHPHAPYCHLWPVWIYSIFPHYLINGTIFEKIVNLKCLFWFSLQVCLKHFSF